MLEIHVTPVIYELYTFLAEEYPRRVYGPEIDEVFNIEPGTRGNRLARLKHYGLLDMRFVDGIRTYQVDPEPVVLEKDKYTGKNMKRGRRIGAVYGRGNAFYLSNLTSVWDKKHFTGGILQEGEPRKRSRCYYIWDKFQ